MKKKIITLIGAVLLTAPYLMAKHGIKIRPTGITLNVENLTNDTFMIAVPGTNHATSRNAVSLEPSERRSFVAESATRIKGPLRLAVMSDMKNKSYSYYEAPKKMFPIMFYKAPTAQMFSIRNVGPDQYALFPGKELLLKKKTTKKKGF